MAGRKSEDCPIEVRPATPGDHHAWLTLWSAYHAYGPQGGAAPLAEVSAAAWTKLLDPAVPMQALLAEHACEMVGFAHIVVHPTTSLAGPSGLLVDLFVKPALHGRGIGRALMQAAIVSAEIAGAVRLTWNVRPDNAAALRLYDSLGHPSGHIVYRRELR